MEAKHEHIADNDLLGSLDVDKLMTILVKSLPFSIGVFLITLGTAFVYLRYTKPVFEASSILKLDFKNEATLLGFKQQEENLNNLAGEMELLMSKLFMERVLEAVDLGVTYGMRGNILDEERYGNSPFSVRYKMESAGMYDRELKMEIVSAEEFVISYQKGESWVEETARFGVPLALEEATFLIELHSEYTPELSGLPFFFVVNSHGRQLAYLQANMRVEALNLGANTIKISFKDHNPQKARDMVNAIDTLYLNYTQQEKLKENRQKIRFLDEQLRQTENKLSELEAYFEKFTITNKTTDLNRDLSFTIQQLNGLDSVELSLNQRLEALDVLLSQLQGDSLQRIQARSTAVIPSKVAEYLSELAQLQLERQQLLNSYNESTFTVQRKTRAISLLRESLDDEIRQQKISTRQRLQELEQKRELLSKDLRKLPNKEIEYSKTERYYQLYESFFLSLMQKKTEFEIAVAGTTTDFKVLSSAGLPTVPVAPKN